MSMSSHRPGKPAQQARSVDGEYEALNERVLRIIQFIEAERADTHMRDEIMELDDDAMSGVDFSKAAPAVAAALGIARDDLERTLRAGSKAINDGTSSLVFDVLSQSMAPDQHSKFGPLPWLAPVVAAAGPPSAAAPGRVPLLPPAPASAAARWDHGGSGAVGMFDATAPAQAFEIQQFPYADNVPAIAAPPGVDVGLLNVAPQGTKATFMAEQGVSLMEINAYVNSGGLEVVRGDSKPDTMVVSALKRVGLIPDEHAKTETIIGENGVSLPEIIRQVAPDNVLLRTSAAFVDVAMHTPGLKQALGGKDPVKLMTSAGIAEVVESVGNGAISDAVRKVSGLSVEEFITRSAINAWMENVKSNDFGTLPAEMQSMIAQNRAASVVVEIGNTVGINGLVVEVSAVMHDVRMGMQAMASSQDTITSSILKSIDRTTTGGKNWYGSVAKHVPADVAIGVSHAYDGSAASGAYLDMFSRAVTMVETEAVEDWTSVRVVRVVSPKNMHELAESSRIFAVPSKHKVKEGSVLVVSKGVRVDEVRALPQADAAPGLDIDALHDAIAEAETALVQMQATGASKADVKSQQMYLSALHGQLKNYDDSLAQDDVDAAEDRSRTEDFFVKVGDTTILKIESGEQLQKQATARTVYDSSPAFEVPGRDIDRLYIFGATLVNQLADQHWGGAFITDLVRALFTKLGLNSADYFLVFTAALASRVAQGSSRTLGVGAGATAWFFSVMGSCVVGATLGVNVGAIPTPFCIIPMLTLSGIHLSTPIAGEVSACAAVVTTIRNLLTKRVSTRIVIGTTVMTRRDFLVLKVTGIDAWRGTVRAETIEQGSVARVYTLKKSDVSVVGQPPSMVWKLFVAAKAMAQRHTKNDPPPPAGRACNGPACVLASLDALDVLVRVTIDEMKSRTVSEASSMNDTRSRRASEASNA